MSINVENSVNSGIIGRFWRLREFIGRGINFVRREYLRRKQYQAEMMALRFVGDHILRDIGLTHDDVENLTGQKFHAGSIAQLSISKRR